MSAIVAKCAFDLSLLCPICVKIRSKHGEALLSTRCRLTHDQIPSFEFPRPAAEGCVPLHPPHSTSAPGRAGNKWARDI